MFSRGECPVSRDCCLLHWDTSLVSRKTHHVSLDRSLIFLESCYVPFTRVTTLTRPPRFLTTRVLFLSTQALFFAWRSRFSQGESRSSPYKSHFWGHISRCRKTRLVSLDTRHEFRFSQDSSRLSRYTTPVSFLARRVRLSRYTKRVSFQHTNYLSTSFKRTPVHSAVLMAAAPQLRPLTILIWFISLLRLPAHCIVAVTECFGNLVFRSWSNNSKTSFISQWLVE